LELAICVKSSAGLAVSIGEQSVSEGTSGAVSSSVTCFRIGDTVLKIGGVCGESNDTVSAGGGTVSSAGCTRVCAFDSASVDRGEGISNKTGITNCGVKAGTASNSTGLTGRALDIEEISNIAATACGLVTGGGALVQTANTASIGTDHTEPVSKDETGNTVDTNWR
jgi:hypothetical protein